MKKLFLCLVLMLGVAVMSHAAVQPPLDLRGNSLYTLDFVGALPCGFTASTPAATGILCVAGRGEVFGVVASSDVLVNYMVLTDSGAVASAGVAYSTLQVVGSQPNGVAQAVPGTVMQIFPRPIQFTNGLVARTTIAPQAGAVWTVLYRPLRATE